MTENELEDLKESLKKLYFFSSSYIKNYNLFLDSFELSSFEAGTKIIKQRELGNAFYLIYEGSVTISKSPFYFLSEKPIAELSAGSFFGEMSLLNSEHKHTASVIAKTDVRIFILKSPHIYTLIKNNPTFKEQLQNEARKRLEKNKAK